MAKFCSHCGCEVDENAAFCTKCGKALMVQEESAPTTAQDKNDNTSIVAIILGALGIIFAWLLAIVGHVLSILGIVLALKAPKSTTKNVALIVSIIGEVCAIISSVSGVIISLL